MRILLFDWLAGGHHEIHVRRFAEELAAHGDVLAAVPDESIPALEGIPAEVVSLGRAVPPRDTSRYLSSKSAATARLELELLRAASARTRPDEVVALYGDGLVRSLARRGFEGARVTLSVFRPRAHYPSLYGARQGPRERAAAAGFERAIARWRRRRESRALLSLDPGAVHLWRPRPGAPAYWLPEPLLRAKRRRLEPQEKGGCVMFGALAPRKGPELLTRALESAESAVQVTLAGKVEDGYGAELERLVARMRVTGAMVDARLHWHSDQEVADLLARARCAVFPYLRHYGMSGPVVEACAVGTPIVAHEWGLLGYMVRRHGLGAAVDCTDPRALREAILRFTNDPDAVSAITGNLYRFAARFGEDRFRDAVSAPFAGSHLDNGGEELL